MARPLSASKSCDVKVHRPSVSDLGVPPADHTIVEVLQRRSAESPNKALYHIVRDDFFTEESATAPALSYSDVDRMARAVAATLSERLQTGDRILLLFSTGLDFAAAFFGCMYAGMVPVPVYPPNRGFTVDPLAGLRGIRNDCQPAAAIIGGASASSIEQLMGKDDEFQSLWWLSTDSINPGRGDDWTVPAVKPSDTALLQYTSGSTGSPRGVMVSHENIIANQQTIRLSFAHMTRSRPHGAQVCWLPFHHDMGLIGNIIHPLYVDVPVYFLSPLDFLRRPLRWLQLISRLGPVNSGGPGFAYDLCSSRVTDEQKANLDLSRWECAYIGADRVSASTIRRFSEAFQCCGFRQQSFYPCYGLAESTLFVTGGDYRQGPAIRNLSQATSTVADTPPGDVTPAAASSPDSRELVGCGFPWTTHEVVIANPDNHTECAARETGEIWIHGPSVATGYWKQPDVTEKTFGAVLAGDDERGPFLRTGDLGFIDGDELFITGRLKDLIIIRGSNYHPADIESAVAELHEAFAPASTAAIGRPVDGGEELVVLQEIPRKSRDFDATAACKAIRQRIAEEFQVQAADIVFLANGSLPKTSSGKIRRSHCRTQYQDGSLRLWKAPASS